MRKIFLCSFVFFGLISSTSANSLEFTVKNNCVFEEEVPKKPIQFNKYYSVDEYNDNVEVYNKKLSAYKKCVSDLINDVNKSIDKLESFGRKAVSKAQSVEYIDYVKDEKD